MNAAKWFDVDAELQKLRSTPPKPPKPPKVEGEDRGNFSHFSHFRWGAGTETEFAALNEDKAVPFHEDGRENAPAADAWLCPHCGQPATIEDVDWSADGKRQLTFWSCELCQVVAVTPSGLREPPSGWVRRAEQ